jgi:hypothetical protein
VSTTRVDALRPVPSTQCGSTVDLSRVAQLGRSLGRVSGVVHSPPAWTQRHGGQLYAGVETANDAEFRSTDGAVPGRADSVKG